MSSKTTTNTAPAGKHPRRHHSSHTVAVMLLFGMFAVASVVMLFAAAAMWLAEWLGSDVLAAAILGGVLALLALGIYLIWLRPAVERITQRLETVYTVALITGHAYDWVKAKVRFLMLLLAVIRRKW